ncbi:pantoate--beta-alanine ligase [Staphylococcus chromogenes]|nr:pantoate--beta-alanine ligase [Staphylococcus chromogenes]
MSAFQPGSATVFHTTAELSQLARAWRKLARPVVLIPAFGELHAGHLSLVQHARRYHDALVIISVLEKADEDLDQARLRELGVDAVFAPSTAQLYPNGHRTTIHPGPLGAELEGAAFPGQFAEVLTAINKLFHISHCTHALLSEQHYQLLLLVQQMVTDLNLEVTVVGGPVVRETDGLALSSHNAELTELERERALSLSAALTAGAYHAGQGPEGVLSAARAVLVATPEVEVDYLTLRSPGLGEVDPTGANRLLVAARVGNIRLLDNISIDFGSEEVTGQPRES